MVGGDRQLDVVHRRRMSGGVSVGGGGRASADVSVVIATRNRRARVIETLRRLVELPEEPAVIVVDDASWDGTSPAVRGAFPHVTVVRLSHNRGAAARNVGVRHAATPYVAFADDDSWWAPGALRAAASCFEAHPRYMPP